MGLEKLPPQLRRVCGFVVHLASKVTLLLENRWTKTQRGMAAQDPEPRRPLGEPALNMGTTDLREDSCSTLGINAILLAPS